MRQRLNLVALFVFVTAEEKGLVGSHYFATKPTVPAARIVANVNVDMPLLLFPLDQVVAFGAENSCPRGGACTVHRPNGLARAAWLSGTQSGRSAISPSCCRPRRSSASSGSKT